MMDNNYQYSKELLHYCPEREIPFLYASSAPPMADAPATSSSPASTNSR